MASNEPWEVHYATPGILPYALRASLRLFKFVPDKFVTFHVQAGHCHKIKKPQPFWLGLYHFNAWQ